MSGDNCKNAVLEPSLSPTSETVLTSLKNCPGKLSNSTFDPLTGVADNLLTATNCPLCTKSAPPFDVGPSTSALAVIKLVPLLI